MAVPLQAPYAQFFDSNGDPLSGGKVYTYIAGTTTPKATYTDAGGLTPAANPIILDSSGRAAIWIVGTYRIDVYTSADVLVRSTDEVPAFTAGGDMTKAIYDAANIVQQLVGTTAVQTLSNKTFIGLNCGAVKSSFSNLKITTLGATSVITADEISLIDTSNSGATVRSVSLTINTATSAGLLAIDTGAWAINTWYYVWVISNGTLTSAIASLSATAPTMPSGYTFKARVGAIRTSGTATTLLATIQYGRRVQYTVTGVSPNAGMPLMASGTAGNTSTPTWVAIPVGSYVPPTASDILGTTHNTSGQRTIMAPNNTYGGVGSTTNAPYLDNATGSDSGMQYAMTLESTNIYWASSAGYVYCRGWEDNL
jgi:hypothetical protein